MPRAAIATDMVDWVLPVRDMPEKLIEFLNNGRRFVFRKKPDQPGFGNFGSHPSGDDAALREVLSLLRARTGRDFTRYKHATILRRIRRRMQLNGIESLPDYVGFLRKETGESSALVQDLLVSVTNFFRDHAAFEALAAEIPRLFKDKKGSEQVRVWVTGRATGEEAYSIGNTPFRIRCRLGSRHRFKYSQLICMRTPFARRGGLYPETIVAHVPEERLRGFF